MSAEPGSGATPDVTVVLNEYAERPFDGPTVRSLGAALAAADSAGLRVQPVVAPRDGVRIGEDRLPGWERVGSDQESRRMWLSAVHAPLVVIVEAGDLIGSNWVVRAVETLGSTDRAVAVPEVTATFDGSRSIVPATVPGGDFHVPAVRYFDNPVVSSFAAPRAAFAETEFALLPEAEMARERWRFALASTAAGWRLTTVRDTIAFVRAAHHDIDGRLAPWTPGLTIA